VPDVGAAPAGLFPAGVVLAVAGPGDDVAPLAPEEEALVARAVERRRRDFTAGRACARAALSALGFPPAALGARPERDPIWPDGVVGSITHTDGWVAAALAPAERFAGLGHDAEPEAPLDDDVIRIVCRPGEPREPHAAKAVFCAKEAVYKAVFPSTREFLEFHDVEVRFARGAVDGGGAFEATVLATGLVVPGRLARADGLVRAGAHLLR
jgi:4'-phosphopantetheinyl transferase EntD